MTQYSVNPNPLQDYDRTPDPSNYRVVRDSENTCIIDNFPTIYGEFFGSFFKCIEYACTMQLDYKVNQYNF